MPFVALLEGNMMMYIILIISVVISGLAQSYVTKNYQKYSKVRVLKGMSGAQVAQHILNINNITDVKVIESKGGLLSDHFDPAKKVVALSPEVYHNNAIASVAVAAHEVGHAIQYATGYHGIKLRNLLLKPTIVASQLSQIVLVIGLLVSTVMLDVGIIMLAVVVLFQLITLPIEFDASARALKILKKEQLVDPAEYDGAKSMLNSAALTYVAAALGAIMNLLYYIMLRNNRRR